MAAALICGDGAFFTGLKDPFFCVCKYKLERLLYAPPYCPISCPNLGLVCMRSLHPVLSIRSNAFPLLHLDNGEEIDFDIMALLLDCCMPSVVSCSSSDCVNLQ